MNIQITNLIDKPLDYVEGFVREINSDKELINEKRYIKTKMPVKLLVLKALSQDLGLLASKIFN